MGIQGHCDKHRACLGICGEKDESAKELTIAWCGGVESMNACRYLGRYLDNVGI